MSNAANTDIIKSIQTQYFEILRNYYGDFYESYSKNKMSITECIRQYIRNNTPIMLSTGEDTFTAKMLDFTNSINRFWTDNLETLTKAIRESRRVGVFGTLDNNTTYQYEVTIKQNAVFFDLVALNDPFYEYEKNNRVYRIRNSSILLFFEAVISVLSVEKYILHKDDTIAVILPLKAFLNDQEYENINTKATKEMEEIALQLFGLNYKDEDFYNCFKVLKTLSDQDISKRLLENNIFLDFLKRKNMRNMH